MATKDQLFINVVVGSMIQATVTQYTHTWPAQKKSQPK